MTFLEVWIGYSIFGITAFSMVFIWAVRTKQFTDFDRARYLALKPSVIEEPETPNSPGKVSKIDQYTWLGLLLLLLCVIGAVLWIAFRLR